MPRNIPKQEPRLGGGEEEYCKVPGVVEVLAMECTAAGTVAVEAHAVGNVEE